MLRKVIVLVTTVCITTIIISGCSILPEKQELTNNTIQNNLEDGVNTQEIVINKLLKYVNSIEIYEESKEEDIAVMLETLNNYQSRLGGLMQYRIYDVKENYITLYISIIQEHHTSSERYYSDAIDIPIINEKEVEENAY